MSGRKYTTDIHGDLTSSEPDETEQSDSDESDDIVGQQQVGNNSVKKLFLYLKIFSRRILLGNAIPFNNWSRKLNVLKHAMQTWLKIWTW